MQNLVTKSLMRLWCLMLLFVASLAIAENGGSVAFYYGANLPVNALSQFDRLIVEPDNVKPGEHRELKRNGSATFAYLSVGEVGPHRGWFDQLSEEATFGTNQDWNSKVMDLASAEWQRFLLQRVSELVSRGYDGLFLDTMDSYQLFAKTEAQKTQQQQGLTNLLYRIKRKHPDIRLIANRGFEIIDSIAPYLEAMAAESLYAGWNNAEQKYTDVPENDRLWLHGQLSGIQAEYGIDIIAIDYVPAAERSKARNVAADIAALGFIPWVANPSLDYVGVSILEVIPRDVLMIFDSRENGEIEDAEIHTLLAMPLEYMGYVPQYHDLAKKPLPKEILTGRYAGIVMWHSSNNMPDDYSAWLTEQFNNKVPMAFFGSLGIDPTETLYESIGVKQVPRIDQFSLAPLKNDALVGYETPVPPRVDSLTLLLKNESSENTVHLTFADKNNTEVDATITGPWGGLALHPAIIELDIEKKPSWIIDPFTFLKKALQLVDAPMPDITTENGNRLWFAHIDGDALPSWAELPGRRLGAEVIRDEILAPYALPHTISIVEGEINGIRAYADRRRRMINISREIFAMDSVELASHTWSHPFKWTKINAGDSSGRYNLPVGDYKFNYEREIAGSIAYINSVLAPPGKETRVLLWTGDAIPPKAAMEVVEKYGLLNMNGGLTVISKARPSVSAISANTRMVDEYVQVYAPIMNENVYTNDWTGPFDGFRDVIETLSMTEHPRRIKPANIYYHFYIGTKAASLRSLKEVYDWSVEQQLHPVFASEYIEKVPYFRTAGVARYLDGRWKISGLGPIRSLRTLKQNAWPDLLSSRDLVGTKRVHDGIYIHTNGANTIKFQTQTTRPQHPHLVAANAKTDYWRQRGNGLINFRLSGHTPVILELSGDKRFCEIRQNYTALNGVLTTEGNTRFTFPTKDTGDAVIDCQT